MKREASDPRGRASVRSAGRRGGGPRAGQGHKALGLHRRHSGLSLDGDELFIAARETATRIASGPRVGVDYAGAWARRRLRFAIAGHASVSRPPLRGR